MRVLKALLICSACAFATTVPSLAQTVPTVGGPVQSAMITVTGEGVVHGAPDMAILSIGVTTEAKTAKDAMAQNSASLASVLERLKAAGIDARDLQTSNLSLNPNWAGYDSSTGGQPRIAGYTATNQLTVRIRALETLGAVLDAAISDGANTLNGLTFAMSDPRPSTDAARVLAVQDARAKATLLVEAAGVQLGRIVSISEGGGFVQPAGPMFRAVADSAPVPVEGGEVAANSNVTIVFEIVQ
jgi:uncharacterized protein